MKVKSFLFSILCMLALGAGFASCSDDDDEKGPDDTGSQLTLPQSRMFILNEGGYGSNNAGIAFYAPNGDADFINDIFFLQNAAQLGETGQAMIEYEDQIFVSVYGSNYLVKLNAAGVEQGRVSFVNDPDLAGRIRYIDAEDGYIYASFWGGAVAKINATTMAVEAKLTGLGDNMEGIAACEGKLYVANSCTADYTTYHNDVKVIDLNTFTLAETLTVGVNPNAILEEDNKIFLISWGNFVDAGYSLQMIDPADNNKVTELGVASRMCAANDMLYLVYSDYAGAVLNTFFTYDIKTGQLNNTSFLKSIPEALKNATIYMLEVNESNGDIYIGTTDYKTTGTIYRFKKDGTFVEEFGAGGINPNSAVFFN